MINNPKQARNIIPGEKKKKKRGISRYLCVQCTCAENVLQIFVNLLLMLQQKQVFANLRWLTLVGLDSGISLWLLEPHLPIHSCQAHA